jgi:hypothetical protein
MRVAVADPIIHEICAHLDAQYKHIAVTLATMVEAPTITATAWTNSGHRVVGQVGWTFCRRLAYRLASSRLLADHGPAAGLGHYDRYHIHLAHLIRRRELYREHDSGGGNGATVNLVACGQSAWGHHQANQHGSGRSRRISFHD